MPLTIMNAETADRPAWWALYTRHQHEKAVAEMLLCKGLEVFLPLHESMRRWKDRQKLLKALEAEDEEEQS